MGTRGFLDGDGERVTVTDFVTGEVSAAGVTDGGGDAAGPVTGGPVTAGGGDAAGGHDGGDFGVMAAFVSAVATGDPSTIRSGARESLESHLMAFAAERSRVTGASEYIGSISGL